MILILSLRNFNFLCYYILFLWFIFFLLFQIYFCCWVLLFQLLTNHIEPEPKKKLITGRLYSFTRKQNVMITKNVMIIHNFILFNYQTLPNLNLYSYISVYESFFITKCKIWLRFKSEIHKEKKIRKNTANQLSRNRFKLGYDSKNKAQQLYIDLCMFPLITYMLPILKFYKL